MNNKFSKNEAEAGMLENAKYAGNRIDKYFQWNLSKFPIEKNKKILDLGCGPCSYFDPLMEYEPELYFATDYSEHYINEVNNLFGVRNNCKSLLVDLLDEKSCEKLFGMKFDYILCFDVLEHLEYDIEALKNISKIIKNTGNGKFFIKVPSLQGIYGVNDSFIGHYRRYTKKTLITALKEAGFKIESIHYHNIFGVLPWWYVGRVIKRQVAFSGNERGAFDMLVPMFKFCENVITPPLGLSLNCICQPI